MNVTILKSLIDLTTRMILTNSELRIQICGYGSSTLFYSLVRFILGGVNTVFSNPDDYNNSINFHHLGCAWQL